jgi:hypothetical protein
MWKMVNEGETVNSDGSCNEPAALSALLSFSNNVGGVIHALDPNHLVSLGVLAGYSGSGAQWCGAANGDYQTLMASSGNDVCDFHDYGYPDDPMGMPVTPDFATALEMCQADGKPLMVAETGIMADATSDLASRATEFEAKFSAQFSAGVVGELMWAWTPEPNFVYPQQDADYGEFPGDPSLGVLLASSSSTATTTTSSTSTTTTTTSPPTTQSGAPTSTTTTPQPATTTNRVKPKIYVSVATLGWRNKIVTTVHCADAKCSGTLKPTKTISTKVEIGHSNRYVIRKTVVVLGKTRYTVAMGSKRRFTIQLNAAGVKLLHAAIGRRLTCELTVTSAAGAKHESISLRIP